jgi:hypothetical protein
VLIQLPPAVARPIHRAVDGRDHGPDPALGRRPGLRARTRGARCSRTRGRLVGRRQAVYEPSRFGVRTRSA